MNDRGSAVIVQARVSSRRFPGKMLEHLAGVPLVEFVYERCRQARVEHVIVATSTDASDDALEAHCRARAIPVHRGPLHDVLARYVQAARGLGVRRVVRVSGDTPLVDIALLDRLLALLVEGELDYAAADRAFCHAGLYSEAVSLSALEQVHVDCDDPACREHVTKHILDDRAHFKTRLIDPGLMPDVLSNVRLTVDYPEDLPRLEAVLSRLPDSRRFTSADVIAAISRAAPCVG